MTAVENLEELLVRELGATVVGSYENSATIPDEYGGGAWANLPTWARQPAEALEHNVRLGADPVEHYNAGDTVRMKALRHTWAVCPDCGEGTMRPKGAGPKRCVITPGCEGSHRP
jgi:hypothetical protein